jgi:hypothetical protein
MTCVKDLSHAREEWVGVLLIRVRVACGHEQRRLTYRVSSRADVETDQQESATFSTEAETLAWIEQWLRTVAVSD